MATEQDISNFLRSTAHPGTGVSARAANYQRALAATQHLARSPKGSADAGVWQRANEALVYSMKSEPGEVHVSDVIDNLSVQYADPEYIGLDLMPIISTDGKLAKTFFRYPKQERLAAPDDAVDIRQRPNEITSSRTTDTVTLTPRALTEFVSDTTVANQDSPLNEMLDATMAVNNAMMLNHEKRVAAIVTTGANYDGNTAALGAAVRWDDAGIDPSVDILGALEQVWDGNGPGRRVGVCPLEVWNVLKLNADIKELYKFIGPTGFIDRKSFASWYNLDDILVTSSREDTANEGQTPSYSRIWGDDFFAIIRIAATPSIRNASFGYSFIDRPGLGSDQFRKIEDGMDGGTVARSKWSTAEKVIAGDTSYLLTTVRG